MTQQESFLMCHCFSPVSITGQQMMVRIAISAMFDENHLLCSIKS